MLQDPQWMLKTVDSTKPYIYYVFSYTYIPMVKFHLYTGHNKRLITNDNRTIITLYCNTNYVTVVSLSQNILLYSFHLSLLIMGEIICLLMQGSEVNDVRHHVIALGFWKEDYLLPDLG